MNLQRREEIRELIAEIAQYEELGAALYLEGKARDAINELLAHIDTLEQTAAERVIARGAVVKPHTFGEIVNQVRDIANQYAGTEQLRERIAYALAPHFEHDAGPTPDYTGEGSAWVPPVEARAVVVPELTDEEIDARLYASRPAGPDSDEDWVRFMRRQCRWAYFIAASRARAIPADRALGDGMVAVDREEWSDILNLVAALLMDEDAYDRVDDLLKPIGDRREAKYGVGWIGVLCDEMGAIDALRANQGGAAT